MAVAHDAERAVEIGLERVAVEAVIAHAEEGEIVGRQPLQELDRFGDLVHRQRRRIGLQIGDDAVDPLQHRPPVLHRQPHVGEHGLQGAHDVGARGLLLDRIDVDMDEALARAVGGIGRAERDQLCALTLHAEHRMRHQPHRELAIGEFAHHRIEQERHVVIGDLDHRDRLVRGRELERLAADFCSARRPLAQEIVGPLGERGEIGGGVTHHVLGHRAGKELGDKGCRHVVAALGERGCGLRDRGARGAFFLAAGQLNGHVVCAPFLGESIAAEREFSPSATARREHRIIW